MQVVEKRVRVILPKIGVNAAYRHVHFRHFPCVGVAFLTVNGNDASLPRVFLNEFFALYEHPAASATGVVYAAVRRRLQNRHNRFYNACGRVELAALDSLMRGELRDAVFIGASEKVAAFVRAVHVHIGEQVHNVAEYALVQVRTGVIFGQNVFQFLIVLLNRPHSVVNDLANLRRMRRRRDFIPAGFLRDKEDVFLLVCVRVILKAVAVSQKFAVSLVKGVGDIPKENQSDNDFSVVCGGNMPPQDAGGVPDLLLKADNRVAFLRHASPLPVRATSPYYPAWATL